MSLCAHKQRAMSVPWIGLVSATANTGEHIDAYLCTKHTYTQKSARHIKTVDAYWSVTHCNPEANKRQIFPGYRTIS